jgi:lysophospholipase L1-like esterase
MSHSTKNSLGHSDRNDQSDKSQRADRRRPVYKFVSSLLGLLLAFSLAEVAARLFINQGDGTFETFRAHLANEIPQDTTTIALPYLLYVPAPGFESDQNYHNEQGYRGRPVPMKRTKQLARVLCLGGSTTYGSSVDDPKEAYPAQLEVILNKGKPEGVTGVEVINAGLLYGTTAEMLTHYHFKYHYFRPDLVVINTGGNDALPAQMGNYQPDYSHWRVQPQSPRPLSPFGQKLMKSRFLALGLISLIYGRLERYSWLDRSDGVSPTEWFRPENDAELEEFENLYPAFAHNLNSLIDEILRDGAKVLLVPYRLGDNDDVPEEIEIRNNEQVLKKIAKQRQLDVAPFPADIISEGFWVDGSHLNAAGCRQKAEHIAQWASRILWPQKTEVK